MFQSLCINVPVGFDACRKVNNRVCFDADTGNSQFLSFNQRGSCATEGIKDALLVRDRKSFTIIADKVRGERENKSVPVMNWHVLFIKSIKFVSLFLLCCI